MGHTINFIINIVISVVLLLMEWKLTSLDFYFLFSNCIVKNLNKTAMNPHILRVGSVFFVIIATKKKILTGVEAEQWVWKIYGSHRR